MGPERPVQAAASAEAAPRGSNKQSAHLLVAVCRGKSRVQCAGALYLTHYKGAHGVMFFSSASAYDTSLQAPTPTIPPFSRYGTLTVPLLSSRLQTLPPPTPASQGRPLGLETSESERSTSTAAQRPLVVVVVVRALTSDYLRQASQNLGKYPSYFDKDRLYREGLPRGGHSSTRTRTVPQHGMVRCSWTLGERR